MFRFNYIFQPADYTVGKNGIVGTVNYDKIYKIGDKIGQLVISQTIHPEFKLVDELKATLRGTGGFGSSDILK